MANRLLELKKKWSQLTKKQKWLWVIGIVFAIGLVGNIVDPVERRPAPVGAPAAPTSATSAATTPIWSLPAITPPAPVRVTSASPATAAATPAPTPSATSKTPSMTKAQLEAWADEIDRDARSKFVVESWQEVCTARITNNWPCRVVGMKSTHEGFLIITLDVSKDDPEAQDLAEGAAHAVFKLLAADYPELQLIYVVPTDGGPLARVLRSTALPNGG
jgi:hypothetical protein